MAEPWPRGKDQRSKGQDAGECCFFIFCADRTASRFSDRPRQRPSRGARRVRDQLVKLREIKIRDLGDDAEIMVMMPIIAVMLSLDGPVSPARQTPRPTRPDKPASSGSRVSKRAEAPRRGNMKDGRTPPAKGGGADPSNEFRESDLLLAGYNPRAFIADGRSAKQSLGRPENRSETRRRRTEVHGASVRAVTATMCAGVLAPICGSDSDLHEAG